MKMKNATTLALLLSMLAGCDAEAVTMDAGGEDAQLPMNDAGEDAQMPMEDAGTMAEERFIAIVLGTLADEPTTAQGTHDAIAGGGEDGARGAGNVHHEIFLGTTLLGTTENQFLATDRWTNLEGARAVYSDPGFIAAFSTLFSEPTAPTLYARSDFHEWGSLDAADASEPRYFVVVRGHLAATTTDEARTMHDAVAAGGEAMARAAGDVSHIVFLGVDDPREFLAIDIWPTTDNLEALYSNPDFAAAFATLFDAPPAVGVYESTSWHQW
jgi:hypothetical protein